MTAASASGARPALAPSPASAPRRGCGAAARGFVFGVAARALLLRRAAVRLHLRRGGRLRRRLGGVDGDLAAEEALEVLGQLVGRRIGLTLHDGPAIDRAQDRVDDQRHRRLGVFTPAVHPDAAGDRLATAVGARLRAARALPQLERDVAAVDPVVGELSKHRGLPRLRESERLDAFAYQVARNAIADHYRKGRREEPVAPESLEDHALAQDEEADDPSGAGRAQLAAACAP